MLVNNLNKLSLNISTFIVEWLRGRSDFKSRSFYGETFSLALLQRTSLLNKDLHAKLVKSYTSIDKVDSQFHWEFNNYALLDYYKNSNDETIKEFFEPLKFKNTQVTNWTLLRSATRLMAKKDESHAINEAKNKINKFQLTSGLILDQKTDKSFQYHCFSMAMIGEIYQHTQDKYFKVSFLKGVDFIRNFILSNGDTLYIGRGQNQSFGYGALIYILAFAYKLTNDKTLLGDIEKVSNFLQKYQIEDGSFPLVMNRVEVSIPRVVDMKKEEFIGWYPYNNYFDYLPFMGLFISKANEILEILDTSNIEYRKRECYNNKDFSKIIKPNYEAIISKSGGYWTNDMPMPYIVSKGSNITPCYGGEQFQKSLYSLEGLPLPYCNKLKKSIRWKSISFLKGVRLWIISPLGIMKREFIFRNDCIDISTKVFSIFTFRHIYLFLNNNKNILDNMERFTFDGYEYSASGKLKKYIDKNKISNIRLKIES
ncbi:hypothetical protein HOK00_02595 [bacterium]|nr:hypothetical protein [bacterium]